MRVILLKHNYLVLYILDKKKVSPLIYITNQLIKAGETF